MFRTHFRENGGRALVSDGRQRFEVDPEVEARQRKAAVRTSFFLLLLVFVIAAAAFWYLWNWRAQQLGADRPSFSLFGLSPSGSDASGDGAPGSGPDAVSAGGSVNVLLLGEDEEAVAAAFVAAFHPDAGTIAAVALPVDTVLPWDEGARLRDAYLNGGPGGAESLRMAVERLIGAPVHHIVRVEFSGFVELVDLLQGVPVLVDTDIVYRDADGRVVFELTPGLHRLSGEEALLFVRYKGDHLDGETRRVERQLRFVEAVAREVRARFEWGTVQDMLRIVLGSVETDLDLVTLTRLARLAMEAGDDAYAVHVLPGAAGDDGWRVDPGRVTALSEQLFRGPGRAAAGEGPLFGR